MKIELEIPDWAMDGFIKVISNTELVAIKEPGRNMPWKIKDTRCNYCGECCLTVDNAGPFEADDEGKCSKLIKEDGKWLCTAGPNLPLCCFLPPPKRNAPNCVITWKE